MDAQQIYDNFHTHAQGTPGLAAGQEAAQRYASNSQNRAAAIQQLIDGVQTGWKGAAAEAAAQGLVPYAVNSSDTHEQLDSGQAVIERQMNSFQVAVSEVRPVPPAPQMQDVVAAVMNGQDVAPMYQQLGEHYAVQAANVDAYSKYVSASQDNTASIPPITPVDLPDAPVTVVSPMSSPSGSYSTSTTGTSVPRLGNRGGVAPKSTSAGAVGEAAPPLDHPGTTGQSNPSRPGSTLTGPSSSAPTPTSPTGQSPPAGPNPGSPVLPQQPVGPAMPVTGVVPAGAETPPTGSDIGITSDRPNITGREDGAGAIGVVDPNPEAMPGGRTLRGQPIPDDGEPESGQRSGVDARTIGENETMPAGSPGPRKGELAKAGPIGSGRRRLQDEDDEYTSKYLEEEDGDELFGVVGVVAPAVIGESVRERTVRYREQR